MTKGISYKAVLVGLLVDICGSLGAGLIIGISFGAYYALQGVPLKEIASHLDMSHSLIIQLASLGLGGMATLMAGFVTGWIAKFYEIKNAIIMGVLSVLISLPFAGSFPAWYNFTASVFTLAPAVMGGYLARIIFKRDTTGK